MRKNFYAEDEEPKDEEPRGPKLPPKEE